MKIKSTNTGTQINKKDYSILAKRGFEMVKEIPSAQEDYIFLLKNSKNFFQKIYSFFNTNAKNMKTS